MARTPEGAVKAYVTRLLKSYGKKVDYDMPVPCGYGKPTLDYVGCANGVYFVVEAKAEGKKPTKFQEHRMAEIKAAGGMAFVVTGGPYKEPVGLVELRQFLDFITAHVRKS